MSIHYEDIIEHLNDHKEQIISSCLFYRPIAKMQKIIVLNAATKYLASKISKEQFHRILDKNKHYADSFGVSRTKLLIDAALKEKPSLNRTPEGHVRFLFSQYKVD